SAGGSTSGSRHGAARRAPRSRRPGARRPGWADLPLHAARAGAFVTVSGAFVASAGALLSDHKAARRFAIFVLHDGEGIVLSWSSPTAWSLAWSTSPTSPTHGTSSLSSRPR